ncbi:MAG: amino acid adenylation domain-containing protein [Rubrivivax sp.]|nr:amino acid adenylation domain-containing protein [Rubrivivax sp.]
MTDRHGAVAPQDGLELRTLLAQVALAAPQALALEGPEGRLDYAGLHRQVSALAARMLDQGFLPGDRVAIAANRSFDSIVAILAAVQAGLGYVPLDLAYPQDRLLAMMADAGPRAVLGGAQALDELRRAIGDFPTLEAPASAGGRPFAAEPDLIYVLFTSGSTGRPKGVAMGHAPLAHLIAWHRAHPRLGQPASTLQFAPLSFDVHFQEIFSSIACAGTLVLLADADRRDPQRLRDTIAERGVHRIFMPYVALQMLAEASRDAAPGTLRDVVSAGEQLQVTPAIRALFARLPGAQLHNHYGPTESHVVTAHELDGDAAAWPDIPPIGAALPHVRVALRAEDGNVDASLAEGELLLGGDTLAHGYLGRTDLSAERFRSDIAGLPGRWYCTGDLVQRDAAGSLTYLGRIDQQLKVDGFRVEPGEIELALMADAAVRDAAVAAPKVPGLGQQLVAYVVLRDDVRAPAAEVFQRLRAELTERLPAYMVPVRFMQLDRLPTTPSGKIDRRSLPMPESVALPKASNPGELIRAIWQDLLGRNDIDARQNLFDLGARSLLVLRFVARAHEAGLPGLSVTDVYSSPTLEGLAALATGSATGARSARRGATGSGAGAVGGIAIVGMAARASGATDVEALWLSLLGGAEGIRHFAPHELDASVPPELKSRPNFVAARGVLQGAGRFDAAFFGISPREAVLLDPQQRQVLELAWNALEHAGIDPGRTAGRIGVYAGTANNTYGPALRAEQPDLVRQSGEFAAMLASEKDYVATRVANRLDLRGPALSIHTACSTGLVAVAQAWHALASGQCEVALAGGATVIVPQEGGYLHVEGGMESADGHCRPFDAAASGTVFGSAGAMVVLKRLPDALADGDTIHAVIRGVGLNNDGGEKASFTAPSVRGQAEAIREALDHAGVSARSIGYVEAHGTGTVLGDPIEVAALVQAWREDTADRQYCVLGSLKGNFGHTIAAAGVLGLIKATLALRHETIPGTLHFSQPNPHIDFAASPFRVSAQNLPWPRTGEPRRAAVSSFGVGGTNAHLVVEEAPLPAARPHEGDAANEAARRRWVLPLSARTPEALRMRAEALAVHLERHPHLPLHEVAATLMWGRKAMDSRAAVVVSSTAEAVSALRQPRAAVSAIAAPRVVFVFPGQGSQHPGMARRLYDEAPAFREALDRCLALASKHLPQADWRRWLLEAEPGDEAAAAALANTLHAQPALFSMSWALAAWLESLDIRPDAMIGHSIGEYAAACRAGVFSVEDAMAAVVTRARAMAAQPGGAMLAVRCSVATLSTHLLPGVEIAGVNAPELTVVAGAPAAIDALAQRLAAAALQATRLKVSHAFHSASMDGALDGVAAGLAAVRLSAPTLPVYSCISGRPLQPGEATDARYWARQVRAAVQFSAAVSAELAQSAGSVFIEVGPGQALSALVRQHRSAGGTAPRVVPLLGGAQQPGDAAAHALGAVGALWCAGVAVGWPVAATARRCPLPGYPFAGEEHWFRRRPAADSSPASLPLLASGDPAASAAAAVPSMPLPAVPAMNRLPRIEQELKQILADVSGVPADELVAQASFVDQGLDSLSLTQATLELERVFGVKVRLRRLLEDLATIEHLVAHLDAEMPPERMAPVPVAVPAQAAISVPAAHPAATVATAAPQALPMPVMSFAPATGNAVTQIVQQQMQLMAQQLALLSGQGVAMASAAAALSAPASAAMPVQVAAPTGAAPAAAPAAASAAAPAAEHAQPGKNALIEKPFGAAARITLERRNDLTPVQQQWLADFIARYNARTGRSKAFSQQHRKVMADPRVVTGFNPMWKDLVYPIVVNRSKGARLWDLDGNEYIDLLSCFGANLLGYQPDLLLNAMVEQLHTGIEVGPQHPMAAEVADLIVEFTGMERVAFCNTGSEAVMGAMRIARTVTGRKTIAIFTNSYHGIFDEVIVRGTRQLRSLSAAPGILANAVENVLVLDWASEASLQVLRERGHELAAIMTEPIQNKYPTVQPREFVQALRRIADDAGCALIFDEVVTGFRVAPGGAQEFYGVRADIATFGKVIGGGLPFAAIAGGSKWLDALDGGHWQYGDDSYPEAGVTYFAGTFVRHPLALAAARASLLHIKRRGPALYDQLNQRTQSLADRLNAAFVVRGAPVKAVHCASLWRLSWDDDQKFVSLFYYLVRLHGMHLYEQFGHFVTEAFGEAETARIFDVFTAALDELMALGFITPRPGHPGKALTPSLPEPTQGELAPGQTERWLAASFDDHARRALNESFCVSLRGPVDVQALKVAVSDVLARHDAFRLRFDLDAPLQTLDAGARVALAEVDLRHRADADAALDEFCVTASERDFPLETAPLAAASLLQLADGRVVVHVVASHLVFDGWASSVFNAELATAYRARSAGQAPVFKAAEMPLEFARAENERFAGPDGQAAVAYWKHVLRELPAPLSLGDRTPPTPRRYAGDTVRARIEGEQLAALRAAARAQGATLFQWLLSAVTVLLQRRGGRDDFLVSIPYAAQNLGRHGPLLADGVLDLPLRLHCQAGATLDSVLGGVRSALMDAMDHPQMTQGTAARALGLRTEGNRPALTGIYFNLNPKVDLSGWAPLVATMHEGRKRGLLSELFFNFYEQADAITLDLHHSTEFFSPTRVQEIVAELVALCAPAPAATTAAVSASAAVKSAKGPAMTPVALDPRLLAWNATDHPLEVGARIETWVQKQAAATPDAVALVVGSERLTYGALQSRANRFAQVLRARGIGAGALVGLCLDRGSELLPALLGVLQTGAAYVPLDPGFPRERLRMMAEDAALPLVITQAAHADLAGLPRERQLRVDDDAAVLAAASSLPLPAAMGNETAAYVIYTSGSTGKPKGVAVPQRAVCNFLASMRREPGLQAGDKLLAVTTLSFDIAVLELLLPLVTGATVVLARRDDVMDGEALARLMAEHRVNVMQATPTTWHLLLDAGWKPAPGFRALCGGEPLPPALATALRSAGVGLWNLYGPTETTVWSTLARIEDASRKISIGRPIDNTQVWVVDEALQPVPVGAEGEIVIGGDGVALGYFKRPELTADRFVALPFGPRAGRLAYRTGDLGRWREDGTLEHLGRLDFQVKLRGYRIELGEIEARLEQAAGVARAVVVAREATAGDMALVGYVVPRPGAALDTGALREDLRRTLPDYMLPRVLLVLASLPLLPNGKVDRKSLPAPVMPAAAPVPAPAAAGVSSAAASSDEMVATIAQHMGQLLGTGSLQPDQNFFELGGHSLMAAKLSAALSAALGHRPGLRAIFESPTPARLAATLREAMRKAEGGPPAAKVADHIPLRADQSTAPLSQMQQRVWFLENLTPNTVVHSIPTGHRLLGPLDLEAFDQAWKMLVKRQSVLRTVIARTPEGDVQRVLDDMPFTVLPVDDLTQLPEAERKPAMNKVIAKLVETPYDLETGPLFTVRVFKLSDQEHGMLFQAHHLIWDAWSFDLLYVDLPELYTACLEKRAPKLPPITVSYGDFSAWHNKWMAGAELQRQVAYWRDQLTPLPPHLELPLDHPRPPVMSGRGGSFQFNLPKDVTDTLRGEAQRHGRTLYVTLLAAYALELYRTTAQADFVIGTPVRGREQPVLEPLMGFFVNMLPLRMRFGDDLPMQQWLAQVQSQVVDSFSFPDVPFDHLVRQLDVPRDPSRPPIHLVMFSYQDVRERTTRWGNVDHQRMPTPMLGAAQDLSLWCVETRNHIEFVFTFNADVLETPTVAAFARRLEGLLRHVAAQPEQRLSQYTWLTAQDQESLAKWNATEAEWPRESRVEALIARQCAATPDRIAVTAGDKRLTYRELDQRSNAVATKLRSLGVGRGSLVGLSCGRNEHMLVGLVGILKAGAGYVPLDPAFPADRLEFMAADAGLRHVVSDRSVGDGLNLHSAERLMVDSLGVQAECPAPLGSAEDVAYVIYTSGSTGRPKGVLVPHRTVTNLLESVRKEPGMTAEHSVLSVTTLSFDIAVSELILPLTVGARIVVADRLQAIDGDRLRALVEAEQVDFIDATPSTWRLLVAAGWPGSPRITAICTGEPLPPDLGRELLPRVGVLWNGYGPTETTVWSTFHRVDSIDGPVPIGHPIANTTIHVVDKDLHPVPIGVVGEIFIGGSGVTLGYLNRPELTAERFLPDPFSAQPGARWYKTGDVGRWRADGVLECLGRSDHQVKVRGYRIELGEIEAALLTHPQVARSLVIAREDSPGDQRLVAYVVPRGAAPSPNALREHLRATLPPYMLPQHIISIDAIPLLPNGKIDRNALPAWQLAESAQALTSSDWVEPKTATEKRLAAIWADMLEAPRVGVSDSFVNLGGHSMLLMRMSARLRTEFGVSAPLNALFTVDKLGDMAGLIDQALARQAQAPDAPKPARGAGIGRFGKSAATSSAAQVRRKQSPE